VTQSGSWTRTIQLKSASDQWTWTQLNGRIQETVKLFQFPKYSSAR